MRLIQFNVYFSHHFHICIEDVHRCSCSLTAFSWAPTSLSWSGVLLCGNRSNSGGLHDWNRYCCPVDCGVCYFAISADLSMQSHVKWNVAGCFAVFINCTVYNDRVSLTVFQTVVALVL